MADIRTRTPSQRYCVVQEFVDDDQQVHPVGETWVFECTKFAPYEDVLTLHVRARGSPLVYRLQQQPEEQAALIEHFTGFVTTC